MDSFLKDLIVSASFAKDPVGSIILTLVVVWSLIWKGLALYHAAGHKQNYWFIAVLLLNTAGILEIAYLFFFAEEKLNLKKSREWLKSIKFRKNFSRIKPTKNL